MNDTTSTPDEPERGGRVATGDQPAVPPQAGAPDPAAPPDGAPDSADSAAAPKGASESAAPPDGAPDPAAAPEGGAPDPAAPPEDAGQPPEPTTPESAENGESAPKETPTVALSGADAPTTQLRLPTPTGSVPHQAARPPAEVPITAAPGPQARPSSPPRVTEPQPAPGPVPGPGPDAAAPPPWHRMPGPEQEATEFIAPRDRPMGGLLDEGPTAFLEPPALPGTGSDDPTGDAKSQTSTGSWRSVRGVRTRPPRQAALQLKRLDPWSMLKLGLVLAVVLFFIWMVAIGVLYGALDGMGVWDRLNGTYADLVSGESPTGSPLISAGRVFGFAAVIGAINSLLFAVAVTVGAFVYNVSADLVGGVEVTLSERD